jgi:hypothetical protein
LEQNDGKVAANRPRKRSETAPDSTEIGKTSFQSNLTVRIQVRSEKPSTFAFSAAFSIVTSPQNRPDESGKSPVAQSKTSLTGRTLAKFERVLIGRSGFLTQLKIRSIVIFTLSKLVCYFQKV